MISRLHIIVTGLVGLYPVGGVAWDYLQYVIGLSRLGHDVFYHEDTWSWPYHPLEKTHTLDGRYSAKYIMDFFSRYAPDLNGKWHYKHLHEKSFGMDPAAFKEVARTADLFINVSGACMIPDSLSSKCVKVFLDTDPGYNQIILSERPTWSENVERWCESVANHDKFFTYAENIHSPNCIIPKLEFEWKTTRMPVVLNLWETFAKIQPSGTAPWTTVMTWNAFKGKLIYDNIEYKSKGTEFEKLIELPKITRLPLMIAVGGVNAPLKRLARHGWQVKDGPSMSVTPSEYQEFIFRSRGEISVAKNVYVDMRSGWFSCRSACYLAAGRPVVVQDTGFSSVLPVGEGILPFKSIEEAADAIQEIEANYARHAKTAREIAEAYFDSDKVLTRLINDSLNGDGKTI